MLRTVTRHPLVLSLFAVLASIGIVGATATAVVPGAEVPVASRPAPARVRAALERYLHDVNTRPGQRARGMAHPSTTGLSQVAYYNWSGYADDNSTGKTYSSVAGTWKQNKVTCPNDEDRIAVWWVGLDGFNTQAVEQDGTLAWCYQGTASYYTWWEMWPTNSIQIVGSVAPGDKIVGSVKFAGGKYTLKLTDSTHTANSFTEVEQCQSGVPCDNASAEWIAETVGTNRGYQPWPSFGTWKLTGAKVTGSGTNGTIKTFPDDEITMIGSDLATVLGTPGALNAAGNSFTVKWNYAWA